MICRIVFLLFLAASPLAKAAVPLPPSIAFKSSVETIDARTIEVRFEIAEGYYLYRDKFAFQSAPPEIQLGAPAFPQGKKKFDENFGDVEVYYRELRLRIPVKLQTSEALAFDLDVTSQGCSEELGLCYPPQKRRFSVSLPAIASAAVVPFTFTDSFQDDESGRIARFLENSGVALIAATFFGFGVLLSLTPCVLPMLPILSGIIVGTRHGAHALSRSTAFFLSLAYVSGMAAAYALAGVLAGFSGTLFSGVLQTPWARGGFASLFVILAFSMFGFYTLRLPACLQTSIAANASQLRGRSFVSVAVMGGLSALIVAPCVAPPLAGALLYVGHSGNAALGGLALFCMAWGMGIPLLAVGASAGSLLPKTGLWMNAVNRFFGFVLLGVAHWLIALYLPPAVQMAIWGSLLIAPAIALRAIDPLPTQVGPARIFRRFAGIFCLFGGVAILSGALAGAKDPLRPLDWIAGETRPGITFERVRSLSGLESRLSASRAPVMLDFYADWCITCKEMERLTFSDARVRKALSGLTLLQADVTANNDNDKVLLARFGLFGPPGVIFFDRQGNEKARVVGFQDAERFLATFHAAYRDADR
ncbi:MAG: protein-disulfide reductase DsbD [Candidatus Accumulibacter sp.]|jgi:thiol:disulfide interchange protein DsbD|nr:protein-disulfide reductase DsbD [Accumulibacter sp.]